MEHKADISQSQRTSPLMTHSGHSHCPTCANPSGAIATTSARSLISEDLAYPQPGGFAYCIGCPENCVQYPYSD